MNYLHLYTAFEDICFPVLVETYHRAVKHIAQKVTKLIGEELMEQEGLEEGVVCWRFEKDETKHSFVF